MSIETGRVDGPARLIDVGMDFCRKLVDLVKVTIRHVGQDHIGQDRDADTHNEVGVFPREQRIDHFHGDHIFGRRIGHFEIHAMAPFLDSSITGATGQVLWFVVAQTVEQPLRLPVSFGVENEITAVARVEVAGAFFCRQPCNARGLARRRHHRAVQYRSCRRRRQFGRVHRQSGPFRQWVRRRVQQQGVGRAVGEHPGGGDCGVGAVIIVAVVLDEMDHTRRAIGTP